MVKLSVSLRNALRALRLTIDNAPIYLHSPEHQNTKSPYICIMDIQTILVFLLFAVALVYVGRLVFKSLQVKKDGCGGNCKCGVDFSDIKPVKK
ncbi:FeoB-associated Cys-rich membrane protein [Pedobacter sp. D749]